MSTQESSACIGIRVGLAVMDLYEPFNPTPSYVRLWNITISLLKVSLCYQATSNSIATPPHYLWEPLRATMSDIVVIVASSGMNLELAHKFVEQAKSQSLQTELIELDAMDWPMYSSSKEQNGIKPEEIDQVIAQLKQADNWLIVSPEYNGSIPPSLTNMVAWISRHDENFREYFTGKSVALATHSGGSGQNVIAAMKTQFTYLGSNVIDTELTASYSQPPQQEDIDSIIKALSQ